VLEAKGTRNLALSNEEIRSKFRGLVAGLVGESRAAEIERRTLGLSELSSAEDLLGLLAERVEPVE
jgi:hypothetical protein